MSDNKLSGFQLTLVILSVYALLALIGDALFKFSPETEQILFWFDNLVCAVFFGDFIYRFRKAENKLTFMKWGWVDLLACVPTVPALRYGVALRLFRVVRVLRGIKSIRVLFDAFVKQRVQGALPTIITIAVLLTFLSAISILKFERNYPEANIKTAEEAIYFSIVTITTVGFGDYSPKSTEARIVTIILMLYGIGLFATITGFLASKYLDKEKENNNKIDTIEELAIKLDEIKQILNKNKD
jgi:voltage-gated potassium channel